MIGRFDFRSLLVLGLSLVFVAGLRAQEIQARVVPGSARPNQIINYVIEVRDGQVESFNNQLRLPLQIQQTSVASTSTQVSIANGQRTTTVRLSWGIMPLEPGEFVLPAQELVVGGRTLVTNEVKLIVEQGGQPVAADDALQPLLQIEPGRKEIYQGEVMQLNCSLYVPRQLQLRRLGLVEIEKSDFAIARFPQQSDQTMTSIDGIGYYVLTFRSTLSSLRTGELKVGPASMEILVDVPIENAGRRGNLPPGFPPGFFNVPTEPRKLTVKSQTVTLKVLPLPEEGRPENFSGAVGEFTITASATPTTLTVGDPLAVDLVVSGSGNFDALTEPRLLDQGGWKAYPAKRYSIEGNLDQNQTPTLERKIGFSQVLIPEAVHRELPPFEINFFNPNTRQYVTLRTETIPLTMTPAPAMAQTEAASGTVTITADLPPPVADPQPELTDIVIRPRPEARWLAPTGTLLLHNRLFWSIQAAPVGLLAIAFVAAWVRRRREVKESGRAGELRRAWAPLESASRLPDSEFLHHAAQFLHVAQGLDQVEDPDLRRLIERYQSLNFAPTTEASLDKAERTRLLGRLRRLFRESLARAALLFLLLTAVPLAAAEESPEAVYREAVTLLEKGDFGRAQYLAEGLTKGEPPVLGADLFELIGHARYRQEDPGRAALWYQRAQLIDGRSPELRQNLRHLFEQYRYLSFSEPSTLAGWSLKLTLDEWLLLTTIGFWLTLLPLTWRVLSRRSSSWTQTLTVCGLVLLLPAVALAALRPASAQRVHELAIVTAPDIRAYTAATTTAGTVIDLPPGSQVRLLEKRGAWVYAEVPSRPENLRGWVENRALTPLWPWDPALIP
jgi:hypothetical protein